MENVYYLSLIVLDLISSWLCDDYDNYSVGDVHDNVRCIKSIGVLDNGDEENICCTTSIGMLPDSDNICCQMVTIFVVQQALVCCQIAKG